MNKFAAFDVDGTLIRWILYHAVVNKLAERGVLGEDFKDLLKRERIKWKRHDHSKSHSNYEATLIDEYLKRKKGLDYKEYLSATQEVANEYKDQRYAYTFNLAKRLKDKGYILLMITGSQEEVVRPVAKTYGFDDFIADKIEVDENGRLTGGFETAVFDKGTALKRLVKKHNLTFEGSYAIGDTIKDAPMLEMVENPIAFNPSKELFEIATKHKWPIVLERKNMIYKLTMQDGMYQLQDEDYEL